MWGKVLGTVASKVVIWHLKDKRDRKREEKKKKELEELTGFAYRPLFLTVMMYILGFAVCLWIMKWQPWGKYVVILGFFGHFSNLGEASKHVSIVREVILSFISLVVLISVYLYQYHSSHPYVQMIVTFFK